MVLKLLVQYKDGRKVLQVDESLTVGGLRREILHTFNCGSNVQLKLLHGFPLAELVADDDDLLSSFLRSGDSIRAEDADVGGIIASKRKVKSSEFRPAKKQRQSASSTGVSVYLRLCHTYSVLVMGP